MSALEYQEWRNHKIANGQTEIEEWEPVACFDLKKNQSVTVKLDYIRLAKYVFLLPTGFRQVKIKIRLIKIRLIKINIINY